MADHDIHPYRREGGYAIVDLSVGDPRQIFNSLDPAPFREKDLDPAAEEYIVEAVREIGATPVKLVIHLPEAQMEAAGRMNLPEAVHAYFAYRQWVNVRRLKALFARGWVALAIGLTVLLACLAGEEAMKLAGKGVGREFVDQLLFIVAWVAMWQPLQVFLYDWWPLWRAVRLYRRLAAVPVELKVRSPLPAPPPGV